MQVSLNHRLMAGTFYLAIIKILILTSEMAYEMNCSVWFDRLFFSGIKNEGEN